MLPDYWHVAGMDGVLNGHSSVHTANQQVSRTGYHLQLPTSCGVHKRRAAARETHPFKRFFFPVDPRNPAEVSMYMSLYFEHRQPKHLKAFQSMAAHWNTIKWVQRNNPSYLSISYKDAVHLRNFHRNISAQAGQIESLKLAGLLQATPPPSPSRNNVITLDQTPSPQPSASDSHDQTAQGVTGPSVVPSVPAQQLLPAEVPSSSGGLVQSHAESLCHTSPQLPQANVTHSPGRGSYLQAVVDERRTSGAGCSTSARLAEQTANAVLPSPRQTSLDFKPVAPVADLKSPDHKRQKKAQPPARQASASGHAGRKCRGCFAYVE